MTSVSPETAWYTPIDENVVPRSIPAIFGGGGGNPYF